MVEENKKMPKVENEVVKKPTASGLPRRTPCERIENGATFGISM